MLLAGRAEAATVVGQIYREQGLTNLFPAAHLTVTLNAADGGRLPPVSTGRWGQFFFEGVAPGDYTLEIWVGGFRSGLPLTREVTVPDRPQVELETIVINREFRETSPE